MKQYNFLQIVLLSAIGFVLFPYLLGKPNIVDVLSAKLYTLGRLSFFVGLLTHVFVSYFYLYLFFKVFTWTKKTDYILISLVILMFAISTAAIAPAGITVIESLFNEHRFPSRLPMLSFSINFSLLNHILFFAIAKILQ